MNKQEALAKIEEHPIMLALNDQHTAIEFQKLLGQSAQHFILSLQILFSQKPELLECTAESIVDAAKNAAKLGLSFDLVLGEAYMVSFNTKNRQTDQWEKRATFIPGYKGLISLCLDTGLYDSFDAKMVSRKALEEMQSILMQSDTPKKDLVRFFDMIDMFPAQYGGAPVGYITYYRRKDGFCDYVFNDRQAARERGLQYTKQKTKGNNPEFTGVWKDETDMMCLKGTTRQLVSKGSTLKSKQLKSALTQEQYAITMQDEPRQVGTAGYNALPLPSDDDMGWGSESETQWKISQGQRDLILKIMRSHVFTDAEREKVQTSIDSEMLTKEKFDEGLKWAKDTSSKRKKKEAAEKKEHAMSDDDIATGREAVVAAFEEGSNAVQAYDEAVTLKNYDSLKDLIERAVNE